MELKFEINEQEIVDQVLENIKDEFIPKSVIEDIKAEIKEEADSSMGEIGDGYYNALDIIDKHIGGAKMVEPQERIEE